MFTGLLHAGHGSTGLNTDAPVEIPDFAIDLNIDQVVDAVAADVEEPDLIRGLLYRQLRDADQITYRQDIFRDLEDPELHAQLESFSSLMRRVRRQLGQLEKMEPVQHRQGWQLDAAAGYSRAVSELASALDAADLRSAGLISFRTYLRGYASSPEFRALAADTERTKARLAAVRYCTRISGGRVAVTRYDGQEDYSAEILRVFERFAQGGVKDYRVNYRGWPGMNHVAAQILQLVAKLFPEPFTELDSWCRAHDGFLDATVRHFERELQLYLAYLRYTSPLREAGLDFCLPRVSADKAISASNTFDLALAAKLVAGRSEVVRNDLHLDGIERIFFVSGPNQGGKTTFARTVGQLHHLASLGFPVPGTAVRLFLFDRLFTHFGREEDLDRLSGKLEDDLIRVQAVMNRATPDSVVILNEIFASTTLHDARLLGEKVLRKVQGLGLICVYVSFVDELVSLSDAIVGMVSTVDAEEPARRTFKVVRAPADGLAYALALAEKHGLTYRRLTERLAT